MKLSALAIFALALLLLSGCASQQTSQLKQPDWVGGDSAHYNSALYMIGRGQAATQEEAKDRARADLSKIFQISVAADSEDVQKFKSITGTAGQFESESSRRIATHTSQIISGIQIAELWQDPTTKNYHALAILPRLQAAVSMRQQIGQLDDATGNHIEQSRKNSDLFLKIAAANLAVETQQERAALQKSLQVIDPTGIGAEPRWSIAKLNNDLDGLLKRVSIASQVADGSYPGFAEIMAGSLAKAGFMVVTGQNQEFVLRAKMELADLGFQDGWYWQRGVLEVALTETATDRVRGTRRWTIKSNAPDKDSALKRALNQADALLKQELRAAIIDMATSR